MRSENLRLFVAITLPEPVKSALIDLAEPLPGVSWTRRAQLHLTMRFLGDMPEERIAPITTHLAAVRVEPFVLPIEGLGTFPPKAPPRVLWIGVGTGHPRLHQLRQQIDDALLAAGLTDLDVRTFHPHVTLARCNASAGPATTRWMKSHHEFAAPPFRVVDFTLYASELRADGAQHTVVQTFALAR